MLDTNKEKRMESRLNIDTDMLVKEDNGSFVKFYTLKDFSKGGMYLDKKIAVSNEEDTATYTIMHPDLKSISLKGKVIETRFINSNYGTAIKFIDSNINAEKVFETLNFDTKN
jgi:hypothetical protein